MRIPLIALLLVVGGLIDRSDQDTLTQVPVLSGIPVLGEAFKKKEVNHAATELIVFVTPRVLDDTGASKLAAIPQAPTQMREQESPGVRQQAIEETLNGLEK